MSPAKYCKKCPKFKAGSNYCEQHKKNVSQFNDWCDWREAEWEAWRVGQ